MTDTKMWKTVQNYTGAATGNIDNQKRRKPI